MQRDQSKIEICITALAIFLVSSHVQAGWFGDIIKVVANPIGAANEEIAKALAPSIGINPEIAGKVINPTGQLVEAVPAAAIHQVKAHVNQFVGLANALKEGRVDMVLVNEVRAPFEKALDPAVLEAAMPYVLLASVPLGKDAYMDAPNLESVNPQMYSGEPVIYVNGMATNHDTAVAEAAALSIHLSRPVQLLYNGTNGFVADLGEGILDRFAPLVAIPGKPEFNGTSKQLAHLFYHAERPVSVVSHSQGCMLVRNGLMIAHTFRPVRHNVAWVATGCPLNRAEIYPEPIKFRALANQADLLVGQISSLNFDPKMFSDLDFRTAHNFIASYVKLVKPADLFGQEEKQDNASENREKGFAGVWANSGNCSITFRSGEIKITNERGDAALGELVAESKIRISSGNGWDAGLEGTLRDGVLYWSNGAVWRR